MQLRITTVQTDLYWEDKTANLDMLAQKMLHLAGMTDIIVLPEMFTTGFSMRPSVFAETMDGDTVAWMRQQAALLNADICGSLIIEHNGIYYNRLVWMHVDGRVETYDKRHLFGLADETAHYAAGSARLLVTCKGWKICPLICYDVRFPVWSSNTDGYDVLLYVANFPERRIQAWNGLLVARAIENQSYVVAVNRIGEDGNGIYHSGDSAFIDFEGNVLYRMSHEDDVKTHVLEYEELSLFRQKLPFLADKDVFMLKL
jgi:predicted amidohydrolase